MSIGYNPKIVTSGLVLCLDAGNTKSYPGSGTTWTDLSGRGNHATLDNPPTYSSSNGGYFAFNAAGNYISRTSNSTFDLSGGDYTIDGWYYPKTLAASQTVLSLGAARSTLHWVLGVGVASGAIFFGTGVGGWGWSQQLTTSTGLITVNAWNNVTVVRNGTTLNIYVNGVLQSTTASFNFGSGQSGALHIGTYFLNTNNDGSWFNGNISNLKFYQGKGLIAQEVQQNFAALRGRFGI